MGTAGVNRLHVLLTNDDGIDALGLQTLRATLETVFRVSVVAPDQERSASGHSITMRRPIYARRRDYPGGTVAWAIDGTPADCAKLAVEALLAERPDCLVSGINHGSNLGRDVFYSGTVSAAMEGMFLGIPSLAVSLANPSPPAFEWAARFLRWWLNSPHFRRPPEGILYNINFPDLSRGVPQAMVTVRLGRREYENRFYRRVDPHGREYFWMVGQPRDFTEDTDTDVAQIQAGLITLTPLQMELTAQRLVTEGAGQPLLVPPDLD